MLAFGAMGTRLVVVQIVNSPAYAQLATDQRTSEITLGARRGAIFDRNGEPLAITVDLQTVYADPELVEDAATAAQQLAPILNEPLEELQVKLQGSWDGSRFEYLARQVPPEIARKVRRLALPGVYMQPEPKRLYPNGRLASHLLGHVDIDGAGLAGVELQYDDLLQGESGMVVEERDVLGQELPQTDSSYRAPDPGRSLFLTIDKEIQYFTELTLAEAVTAYGATSGIAVIMRPGTGEILALANVPDFDPNRAGEFPDDAQRNRGVTDVYEPGSAYKIVASSGVLEERVVTPRTMFTVPDEYAYSDRVFHDSHPHATERMSVTEIIEQSSNVGTIQIGLKLGGRKLDAFVRDYGFGSKTGLDFPGESPGIVLDRDDWSGSTIATIPIGQGIAVTALQMVSAYSAIANQGMWVEPKLLYGAMDERDRIVPSSRPGRHRVISKRVARQMVSILQGVVKRGTGTAAMIPGYAVAGKTGTAQKPLPGGGYGSSYTASFAGFAPAHEPEVVAIVVLDEPSPIWGGLTAAPTFRTIVEFALRHLGVAPTGDAEKAAREIEAAGAEVTPAHD